MNALFFDIDSIIKVESKVWVVSKKYPNRPLIKLSESEFNLIQTGIFKTKGVELNISGKNQWISEETYNLIKSACKKNSVDITALAFSMKEFNDPEIIDSLEYHIFKEHLIDCKNYTGHIYLLCSKNTLRNYEKIIQKVKSYLESIGVELFGHYALSETFFNRDEDKIVQSKNKLLIQHLVGYKTDDDKFTDNQIQQYKNITYYDSDSKSIDFSKSINNLLKILYDNSTDSIKDEIKTKVDNSEIKLLSNFVTYNLSNPFVKFETKISLYNLVKSFESFKWRD